jgi:hypothetical protein
MSSDIDALMAGGLEEWLADQAQMRASARERAISRAVWSAVVLMPALSFLWFSPPVSAEIAGIATFLGLFAALWLVLKPITDASHAIKVGINAAIAARYGLTYDPVADPGVEFAAARTYGLVPAFDRSRFEDRWHGTLEGHDFDLYEACLEEERGSGKNRSYVTVFRGPVIRMGFGRAFRSTTLLQRAGKHRKWLGLGGASDHVTFERHRLDRVDQIHPAFDEVFALYSDDQVEARVLVHPAYIEHLLALEKAFEARELRALFRTGEVILVLETGALFESGGMSAARDREKAARAARQFGALAGLALAINQTARGRTLGEGPATAEGL